MLNQHDNLVVPKSDHLRVGDCVVDIARREVNAPGAQASRRITVKALQVLLVLVAHHGKVVSREALLEWVWSGTFPGDDVLTQAITQLRKAFGDERDAPRYLETIAKGGYRLLADVAWLPMQRVGEVPMTAHSVPAASNAIDVDQPAAAQAAPEAAPAAAPRFTRNRVLLVAALACIAVFVGFAWRSARAPSAATAKPVIGQTTPQPAVPDLAFSVVASQPLQETRPSLSPDGSLIAYVISGGEEGSAIYVQATAAVAPTRLTTPPVGSRDAAPRWSPDGRQIMFIRSGEDDTCELQLIPASGGVPRPAGSCLNMFNGGYDWMPDGRTIIASGSNPKLGTGTRLQRLDLSSGNWHPFPYRANPGDVDIDPRPSPDGRWLVFRRNVSNSDFWRVPISGGAPERLTHLQGNIMGWDWTSDSKALVFAYLRSGYVLQRFDIGEKRMTALGITGAQRPDIAARAPVMVFETVEQQTGLFRQSAPGAANGAASQSLFPSSGSDLMPSISPDGTRIAFYSDRTRESRVWIGAADGAGAPTMVDGIVPVARHPPRWVGGGQTLLVIGYGFDDATDSTSPGVFAIEVRSGRVRRLDTPQGLVPVGVSPMSGGHVLLVADAGEGRLSMRVFDTANSPWRELARRDKVGEARYDPVSDAVWYVRTDAPGLWRTGTDLKMETRVNHDRPAVYWMRMWLLAGGQPYLTHSAQECAMAWIPLQPTDTPWPCLERTPRYAAGEPTRSGDGRWLYYSAMLRPENTDVGTVRLD